MADELEFGGTPRDAPAERQGLLGRLTATSPEPRAASRQRLQVNYVALGLAVAGFLAVLAAHYLPWIHVQVERETTSTTVDTTTGTTMQTFDVPIGVINSWESLAYEVAVMLALALVATAFVAPGTSRRVFGGAALGLLAAQTTVLVGISSALTDGPVLGAVILSNGTVDDDAFSIGSGFYLAVLACLLLAAGVVVLLRAPHPARIKERAAEDEPIDLVVTPLPGPTVDIRSERA
jgi:hypothetical protein